MLVTQTLQRQGGEYLGLDDQTVFLDPGTPGLVRNLVYKVSWGGIKEDV